jgi:hypothetical protein
MFVSFGSGCFYCKQTQFMKEFISLNAAGHPKRIVFDFVIITTIICTVKSSNRTKMIQDFSVFFFSVPIISMFSSRFSI